MQQKYLSAQMTKNGRKTLLSLSLTAPVGRAIPVGCSPAEPIPLCPAIGRYNRTLCHTHHE